MGQSYFCDPIYGNGDTDTTDVAECIELGYAAGCTGSSGCKIILGATDGEGGTNFYLDQHYALPADVFVTGVTGGGVDCDEDPDNCELQTWIEAAWEVVNGCGWHAEVAPGHPDPQGAESRIGFILNNDVWIGNFNFVS